MKEEAREAEEEWEQRACDLTSCRRPCSFTTLRAVLVAVIDASCRVEAPRDAEGLLQFRNTRPRHHHHARADREAQSVLCARAETAELLVRPFCQSCEVNLGLKEEVALHCTACPRAFQASPVGPGQATSNSPAAQ